MSRVRYIRLSTTALELMQPQPDSEKARFVDILLKCFYALEAGEDIKPPEDDKNPYMRIALKELIPELAGGYNHYKRLSSGLVDQRSTNGQSMVDQRSTNGKPEENQRSAINHISSKDNQSDTNINQIRSSLKNDGYMDSEIDIILSRTPIEQMKNPEVYIRKAIDSERMKKPPEKKVNAQQYTQRDYHISEAEQAKRADDILDSLL